MSRPGLYANIHAKRKRGGKMRKKGAKGAPKASDFARAKKTARKRNGWISELRRKTASISRAGDRRGAKESIQNAYHLQKPHG
jgi:hypothetical protein